MSFILTNRDRTTARYIFETEFGPRPGQTTLMSILGDQKPIRSWFQYEGWRWIKIEPECLQCEEWKPIGARVIPENEAVMILFEDDWE